MLNQSINKFEKYNALQTSFSNFSPFNQFENLIQDSIEEMQDGSIKTWVIDFTDVVILGTHHLNYFIDSCLPRIKHLNINEIKVVKSKYNFDTSFDKNLKRALSSMNFKFEYSHGVHELSL